MEVSELKSMLDTLWVLVAGFLVFFMNAGFALVESGLCRAKNTVNILAKNFMAFSLAVIGFWSVGYALMFGEGGALVGGEGFFLAGIGDEASGLPLYAFFFFQLCFAVTAATIVSGAVAERIKIHAFMIFAVVLTAGIYPVVGHWAWGGGWLSELGFADFAGSTVVHSVGGWAALVGAAMLGPRIGRYDSKGRARPIPGHNMTLVTLGGLILWLGWFGFNAGSELAANGPVIAHVSTTTALAAAFGTAAAAIWSWLRIGKPDLTLIVNGMLGGLVGVTAGCRFVEPYSAAIIGTICGLVVIEAVVLFDRVKVDDPVGATSVHLVCGVLGTLLTGVFGSQALGMANQGLIYGGGLGQLWIQLQGVLAVGAFVGASSVVVWWLIDRTVGIRVSEEDEMIGLDLSEHGMEAYPVVNDHPAFASSQPASRRPLGEPLASA
ncbi:MAG: ammonium transporter [Deltaproteobacteria bacterium]|nr:ammonium transporter [Deltaproteobacteria bacterium]